MCCGIADAIVAHEFHKKRWLSHVISICCIFLFIRSILHFHYVVGAYLYHLLCCFEEIQMLSMRWSAIVSSPFQIGNEIDKILCECRMCVRAKDCMLQWTDMRTKKNPFPGFTMATANMYSLHFSISLILSYCCCHRAQTRFHCDRQQNAARNSTQ